jgi:hypothetical protein
MDNNNPLIRDLSINLLDTVKNNKDRFDALRFAMNQNGATVFLAIGLHFDHRVGQAFPVICGSQWIERDQAIQLLQEALTALNTKLLDDAQGKV